MDRIVYIWFFANQCAVENISKEEKYRIRGRKVIFRTDVYYGTGQHACKFGGSEEYQESGTMGVAANTESFLQQRVHNV